MATKTKILTVTAALLSTLVTIPASPGARATSDNPTYTEDFQAYTVGAEPTGWVDTAAGNSMAPDPDSVRRGCDRWEQRIRHKFGRDQRPLTLRRSRQRRLEWLLRSRGGCGSIRVAPGSASRSSVTIRRPTATTGFAGSGATAPSGWILTAQPSRVAPSTPACGRRRTPGTASASRPRTRAPRRRCVQTSGSKAYVSSG
jgi:hypothetical protein